MSEPRAANEGVLHAPDTTRPGVVLLVLAGLAAVLLVVLLTSTCMRPRPPEHAGTIGDPREPPAPGFALAEHWVRRADERRDRARAEERLRSYGWVDRRAGVIHIPVERAIELFAAEGTTVSPPPEEEPR